MTASAAMKSIAAPLALAFTAAMAAPAFAHHMDSVKSRGDSFSCKRTDLKGLSPQDMAEKILPSTVVVFSKAEGSGQGSGVVIDSDKSYIVTNHHVIDGMGKDKIQVLTYDREGINNAGEELDVKLVGTDPLADIAVLQVTSASAPKLPCTPLGDSGKMRVLDPVFAVGTPLGQTFTVTAGHVSAKSRRSMAPGVSPVQDFIQTDAAINPGNSGGPLFNKDGEVIGINDMIISKTGGSEGLGYAIESNLVRYIADSLIHTGKVSHGILGIGIKPVTKEKAAELGMKSPRGVLVEGNKDAKSGKIIAPVQPGGPADKAGVKEGDVIVKFGGHDVREMEDLRGLVMKSPAGLQTDLTVLRGGKELSLNIKLGEYVPPPPEEEQQPQLPPGFGPPPGGNPHGGPAPQAPGEKGPSF